VKGGVDHPTWKGEEDSKDASEAEIVVGGATIDGESLSACEKETNSASRGRK
jgi:hypothetical protein